MLLSWADEIFVTGVNAPSSPKEVVVKDEDAPAGSERGRLHEGGDGGHPTAHVLLVAVLANPLR